MIFTPESMKTNVKRERSSVEVATLNQRIMSVNKANKTPEKFLHKTFKDNFMYKVGMLC